MAEGKSWNEEEEVGAINKSKIKGCLLYNVWRPLQKIRCIVPNLFCSLFPMTNTIIMESNPDLADNTFEVYRYIIAHNILPDYKIVWRVNDPNKYRSCNFPARVSFTPIHPGTRKEKIHNYILCNRAKVIIDCNRHYPKYKTSKSQLNIYLDHGMPLKDMTKYNHPLDLSCGYSICQSEFFTPYIKQQYGLGEDQIVVAGVPRDDQLFITHDSLLSAYPEYSAYSKIIAWVPTFRKIAGGRVDCSVMQPFGMPIFQELNDIVKINGTLQETNTLLIIKPHPAQDLSFLGKISSTNIKVLYNDEMLEKGIQTNELLEQTDAMISDYSGIYFDYLLLNKPIGITLDDFEDYSKQKGFVYDDPLAVIKGRYIYTTDDFIQFINETAQGKDVSLGTRKPVNKIVNAGMNAYSTKRVVDFLIEKVK